MVGAVAALLPVGSASGNGRFPTTTSVRFHPSDSDIRIVATTFGLLLTGDGGASHHWVCESAVGYAGTFDPDYAVAADGSIFATTFDGLRVTRDGGCTWELTGSPIDGLFPGAIEIASNGYVWAVATKFGTNGVFFSDDNGLSFNKTSLERAGAWWHALAIAPGDSDRIFVSGFVVPGCVPDGGSGQPPALLFRSDNGGTDWTELPVSDFQFAEEPLLFVEAVSATDPDLV